jgi:hypothetical protein
LAIGTPASQSANKTTEGETEKHKRIYVVVALVTNQKDSDLVEDKILCQTQTLQALSI